MGQPTKSPDVEPLVSVLTPVYNGEKYLSACIESVLAQTYSNWEYVIVNNCSTDRSKEIAESYAARDHRIRVVDNMEFLDVISNLNNTLRQIAPDSKYTKLILADDFLFPECIDKMVALAETHPKAGMVGSYRLERNKVVCNGLKYPKEEVSGEEVCRGTLQRKYMLFGYPSGSMFRSEIVRSRHEFYDRKFLHADVSVAYEILKQWNFGFVYQVLVGIRHHEDSQSETHAERYGTMELEHYLMVRKYGPVFFDGPELDRLLKTSENLYYRRLARRLLRARRSGVYSFQVSRLREEGLPLRYAKLLFQGLRQIGALVFQPRRLAGLLSNTA